MSLAPLPPSPATPSPGAENSTYCYHLLIVGGERAERLAGALRAVATGDARYQIAVAPSIAAARLHVERRAAHAFILAAPITTQVLDLLRSLRDRRPETQLVILRDHAATALQALVAEQLGAHVLAHTATDGDVCSTLGGLLGIDRLPAASERPAAEAPPAISSAQQASLTACLAEVARRTRVRSVLLADLSGQEIAHWDVNGMIDPSSVAALAAGDLQASLEIGRTVGGLDRCTLIVQEHERGFILTSRVGDSFLLLLVADRDVPLGRARLAVRHAADHILALLRLPPPRHGITPEFAGHVATRIDSVW